MTRKFGTTGMNGTGNFLTFRTDAQSGKKEVGMAGQQPENKNKRALKRRGLPGRGGGSD